MTTEDRAAARQQAMHEAKPVLIVALLLGALILALLWLVGPVWAMQDGTDAQSKEGLMLETGLAFKLMWVLVLFQGYPDYYNPVEETSYAYRAFVNEDDCQAAKAAMERGFYLSGEQGKGRFVCVHEEALVTK